MPSPPKKPAPAEQVPSGFLTPREAARLVNEPVGTIFRWAQQGRLTAHALAGHRVLIRESDLAALLEGWGK